MIQPEPIEHDHVRIFKVSDLQAMLCYVSSEGWELYLCTLEVTFLLLEKAFDANVSNIVNFVLIVKNSNSCKVAHKSFSTCDTSLAQVLQLQFMGINQTGNFQQYQ